MILLAGLVLFSWEDGAMIKVIIIIGLLIFLFPLYACLVVAKKADEKMRVLCKYKEKWESEDNI